MYRGLILFVLGGVFLAFQNCASSYTPGVVTSSSVTGRADFSWVASGDQRLVTVPGVGVRAWRDRGSRGVSLFPPVANLGLGQADLTRLPTGGSPVVSFGPNQMLTTQSGDAQLFTSAGYSAVLHVRNVTRARGEGIRLIEMQPTGSGATGHLGIDVVDGPTAETTRIMAYEFYDGSTMAYAYVDLPNGDLTRDVGISTRFGIDPAAMYLNVNGVTGALATVGTPPNVGESARLISIHGYSNSNGSFDLVEAGLWTRELDDRTLYLFFGQGPPPAPPIDQTKPFAPSQAILQTNCLRCHGAAIASAATMRNAKSANGVAWITPGDAANSLIINALRRTNGAKPMPPDAGALPDADIAVIAGWIDAGAP